MRKEKTEHRAEPSMGRQSYPIAVPGRRLQALARVLQGRSECVAVAFVNGRFLIAANELTARSPKTVNVTSLFD